jgi:hypothetical protein
VELSQSRPADRRGAAADRRDRAFILGVYLIQLGFPSLSILPGAVAVIVAVTLRPRLGRLDRAQTRLSREQAPTLYRLIEQVATTVGAPMPDIITVDSRFNASAGALGLRRRRVLCIGLPLWGPLPPQQRVALLGHELGHFVNGDVRRGPLTQIPLNTLGSLADLLRPTGTPSGYGGLVDIVSELLLATLRSVFLATCCEDMPSARTVSDIRGCLRSALSYAIAEELITKNVAAAAKLPRFDPAKDQANDRANAKHGRARKRADSWSRPRPTMTRSTPPMSWSSCSASAGVRYSASPGMTLSWTRES